MGNLSFDQNFAENWKKIKEIGRKGSRPKFYYVDPPLSRGEKLRTAY